VGESNWLAAMAATDLKRNARFAQKLSDLQNSDPIVDWSGVNERDGQKRRVAKWLSEL
jgi:hypothetical protein